MNFHIAAFDRLFSQLGAWVRQFLSKRAAPAPHAAIPHPLNSSAAGHRLRAGLRVMAATDARAEQVHQRRKPLRVIRVPDAQGPRTGVGRMVMSGTMAEICAELDRLAAWEASVQSS